jgi:hypothetical protein
LMVGACLQQRGGVHYELRPATARIRELPAGLSAFKCPINRIAGDLK